MQKAPEQIGPYLIRNKIGESPLYIEYLASDSQREQNVVLRVPGEAFPRTPARLTRFVTAGQRAARLQHEHIVPVIDAGQADGEYYIATAYVAGQRLTDLLANSSKAVGVEQVADFIDGIAAALDHAHSQGIDHEGLTTDNVILTQDGRVLVTDFCLAEGLDSSELVHSGDDPAFASYFLAPEQIRTDVDSDYRADIYSLGVVAYAMLTRNLPFEAFTQGELLHKIVNDIPRSPDLLNPQMPAGVAYVLRNVLAKEPEVRYSSAGDFHDALLAGMAWTAPTGAAAGGVEIPPQRSRRGLVSALLALLVLALIAGGAYFVLQPDALPAGLTGMAGGGATGTASPQPTDDASVAVAAATEEGGTEAGSTEAGGTEATDSESARDETAQENAGTAAASEPTDAPAATATPSPSPTATATPTARATETATATPAPTDDQGETAEAPSAATSPQADGETEDGESQNSGVALRLPTPTTVANGITNGGAAAGASQSAAAAASEMTATNTPQATATNTVAPTATNTPASTATSTAAPTATNTPRPTATNTSAPAATNTPRPTATSTTAPTATSTTVPTTTNTPRPTATNTSAPVATNTPRPTATSTTAPTATNTPLPTATNTSAPTATNTPAPPPPTNTATNTPAPLPTATSTPIPTGSGVVQLLTPASGSAGSGSQTFTWSTALTPPAGQAFELVFWPAGQSPMGRGFGMAAPTTGNQLNINLSALDNSGNHPLEPGDYQWGLLLVQTEPSYQRLQFLGAQSAFRYYRDGGGSSGGDPGGPPSTGE